MAGVVSNEWPFLYENSYNARLSVRRGVLSGPCLRSLSQEFSELSFQVQYQPFSGSTRLAAMI